MITISKRQMQKFYQDDLNACVEPITEIVDGKRNDVMAIELGGEVFVINYIIEEHAITRQHAGQQWMCSI